ncbi:MAG: hydrogenase formation protein HypD [Anaerolineales bacterium]|jgi:hydrogenase expression/formation protein HypD
MKYVTEFRDARLVRRVLEEIRQTTTHHWVLMEMCGGQTHAILRHGLDQLLPPEIELVHGPGCPVCVTPLELIDKAQAIASRPEVILTAYGDVLKVPGSRGDLFSVRARGGDVRVVYSPLDAIKIAQSRPDREIVFFAIGFETTAPANAMSVIQAKALGLKNYSILVSQVCVPSAMKAILGSPHNRVQGFLGAGHICAVMGYWEYQSFVQEHHIPIVVTGFEPLDIAQGILQLVQMLETGHAEVGNAYSRAVTFRGNQIAQNVIARVFCRCDRNWRGIGIIPSSGLGLKPGYAEFDAEKKFQLGDITFEEEQSCIAGHILQGLRKPSQCDAFGIHCSPEKPLGALMVSAEGTCAAYYRYRRHLLAID